MKKLSALFFFRYSYYKQDSCKHLDYGEHSMQSIHTPHWRSGLGKWRTNEEIHISPGRYYTPHLYFRSNALEQDFFSVALPTLWMR